MRLRDGRAAASAGGTAMAALVIGALGGCEAAQTQPVSAAEGRDLRTLPEPRRDGGPALATVLASRRSQRAFGGRELEDAELGQILWAAQGVTDGHRTAPSAGALYPLAIRVVDRRGVWRYLPADHALAAASTRDARTDLSAATYGQDAVRDAPVVLAISAEVAITARKYGARAERYATLEAGHAAQNILLTATALGLAAVPVGAFDDAAVGRAIDLPTSETPLYLIPVGPPP